MCDANATASVTLVESRFTSLGHGGRQAHRSYEIYLNDVRLRGFSERGDMTEGYWGSRAGKLAEDYAKAVACTLGVEVTRARRK